MKTLPYEWAEALMAAGKTLQAHYVSSRIVVPRPSELKTYEEVMPGLAGKIVGMVETEVEHRRAQEKEILRRGDRCQLLGLCAAVVVALSGFALAAFVSQKDPRAAAAIVGGELGVMVAGFLRWKRVRSLSGVSRPEFSR